VEQQNAELAGLMQSPGGFVFGVSGWSWGEPRPKSITFFLDGTAKVSDQHGRPIKGTVMNNKEVLFAMTAPAQDEPIGLRNHLATHAQVVAALTAENVEWRKLSCAGWPQLSYAELKKLPELPPTPIEELRKITDPQARKDASRARREVDEARSKELELVSTE